MRYKSTRNSQLRLEASQVIAQGISEEGGLFVPETLPDLREELPALAKLEYPALAKTIFRKFLTDFTPEEVGYCVDSAYMADKFDGASPVKLVPLLEHDEDKYLLELWHGPTCAFKDMALQILPYFLTTQLLAIRARLLWRALKTCPAPASWCFTPGMVSVLPKRNRWSHRRGAMFVCALLRAILTMPKPA